MLQRTLESVAALTPPAGVAWEVLVVDNNSTDDTAAALREFQGRLPFRGPEGDLLLPRSSAA